MKIFISLVLFGLTQFLPAGTVSAQIYWQNNQFVIDQVRPNWQGAVANLNVVQGQTSRNHIIAFEVIQNDLANFLNQGNMVALTNMTDALFTGGPNNELIAMQQARVNLVQVINNANVNAYQAAAQVLLELLNSSSANVRVGDAVLNGAIGQAIDAEFLAGLQPFNGNVLGANGQFPFGGLVLLLTPHSNAIVYNYQEATGQGLWFVVNGINGALNQAAPNGVQLSSTQLPQIPQKQLPQGNQAYPVLVTDPNGQGLPFLYQ